MPLAVTERAAEALKETLDTVEHGAEEVLRLVPAAAEQSSAKLGLALDRAREDDQVVEYDGSRVLAVDKELSEYLSTSILDAEEGSGGRQLTLKTT